VDLATNPKDCWNTRRKSMMRTSYSMTRRRHEVRKEDIFERWKLKAQVLKNRDTFRSG
jgi:hypothetical protein